MTQLPIYSALSASILLSLQMVLMLTVGMNRVKYKQGVGDGGHQDLELKIRRHANLAENAAIFLLGLALLEILGGNATAVLSFGAAFVIARILHAIGLTMGDGPNAPRFLGATGTALVGIGTAAYLFYIGLILVAG